MPNYQIVYEVYTNGKKLFERDDTCILATDDEEAKISARLWAQSRNMQPMCLEVTIVKGLRRIDQATAIYL